MGVRGRLGQLQTALDALQPAGVCPCPEPEGALIDSLLDTCGGDEGFARELALTFLESAPGCLSGIDLALQSGEYTEISAQAHALKGISRTIGAEALALACAELEQVCSRKDLEATTRAAADLASAWDAVKNTL